MGKTRKEHKCEFCGKVIPKGTDTSEIVILSAGGRRLRRHTLGSHHGAFSHWGFRKYYHKDCYIIRELTGKRKADFDFWVQRTITSVIYHVGNTEIEIALSEDWNKAVEKDNQIYEFARVNGLTIHPELDLKSMQIREE